ncbi:MAG TPA: GAF domain-containing protein, partial [Chloroflexi bacterium]|nr:GAF domain-containing protein [Chloroflexota bacterium]
MSNHTSQPDLLQNMQADNRRARILETVYQITEPVRPLRPLDETLAEIDRQIRSVFQPVTYFLGLVKPRLEQIVFPYALVENETVSRVPVPLHDNLSLAAWAVVNKTPFATNEGAAACPVAGLSPFNQLPSVMCAPLVVEDAAIGVICVQREAADAYSPIAFETLKTAADHLAVIVHNAILYENSEQQLAELATLYQASATMTANLDQDFVLQTVVSEMVRALQVDSCTIFVWDKDQQTLIPAAHQSHSYWQQEMAAKKGTKPLGLRRLEHLEQHPLVRRIFHTRKIESLRTDQAETPEEQELLASAGLKSVMLVPLVRREEVLGILALGEMLEPRSYGRRALRLAQNLAGQAAVAIEHAHLFSQAQRRIEELSTFHDIVLQLNTPLQLKNVLDEITQAAL